MSAADLKLVIVALLAIGTLVLLVTRFRVNAFLSLLLASLVVGASAVGMGRTLHDGAGRTLSYSMSGVVKSFSEGLGATLGGIATVIGLGTMLGKLLAESGGAEVLAKRFATFFGPKHIQWCIMALALAVGLTTWFAVGFVLLLPILLSLTYETKQPFLSLVLPLLSCMSVMHGLMPPHPGPVVAVAALNAQMGLVLFWGFVIGIPTAAVAGPLFARYAVRRVQAEPAADAAADRACRSVFAADVRADAAVDPAAGGADAAGDAGRAGAAARQPPARDDHVHRQPDDGAAHRGAVRWLDDGHAVRVLARADPQVHRGVRLRHGHDGADRRRWRRLRARRCATRASPTPSGAPARRRTCRRCSTAGCCRRSSASRPARRRWRSPPRRRCWCRCWRTTRR